MRNDETITLDRPVEVSGFDMAKAINYVLCEKIKLNVLNRFLETLDDKGYAIVCQFVKDNPHV